MNERKMMVLENHPADSRVKVAEDGIVQTLSGRMGTGGNNVPMVVLEENEEIITMGLDRASFNQGKNAKYDFAVEEELAPPILAKGPGGTNQTIGALCARDYKGVGNQYVNEGKVIVQDLYDGETK